MKHIVLIASLALFPPAATFAQESDGEIDEGFSLMEEGARQLFRGLMNELDPAIEDFAGAAEEMGPALERLATEMGPALLDLFRDIDSVSYYDAPEILPNGDIIIRRSPDAPLYVPEDAGEAIDL